MELCRTFASANCDCHEDPPADEVYPSDDEPPLRQVRGEAQQPAGAVQALCGRGSQAAQVTAATWQAPKYKSQITNKFKGTNSNNRNDFRHWF